jgi:hypothetical protein
MTGPEASEVSANRLATFLLDTGLAGAGPLSSAEDLAREYLIDSSYGNDDRRVDALIRREMTKNFTSGFITGLGGLVTFPVSIPAALGASWLIQARMAGAIARIYGHDLNAERVRTKILLSLAGDVAKDAMKDLGLKLDNKLTQRAVDEIPGGGLDAVVCRMVGRTAKTLFRPPSGAVIDGEVVATRKRVE